MNPVWIRKAAALPARQLHMMGAGLLLIVGAALWFYALRAPLTALRAVRTEQAQLALTAGDPQLLAAQLAVLQADTGTLASRLGAGAGPATAAGAMSANAPANAAAAQPQVRLIATLGNLAQEQGVSLHGIAPVPDEMALSFIQHGFDAEASGSYASLLAWMSAIERSQPNLAVAGFEMRAADTPGQVAVKIRIAAFAPQESTP